MERKRSGSSGREAMGSLLATLAFIAVCACGPRPELPEASSSKSPADAYAPGLGEIMTLQQMRHVKLWLAGQTENWELVAYELDELGEGFDDVVRFHPTHKDAPVAPRDAIPRMVDEPLARLREVAERKDAAEFVAAYDALTEACNGCHKAMSFGFNVVGRPTGNPYVNQIFQLPR